MRIINTIISMRRIIVSSTDPKSIDVVKIISAVMARINIVNVNI